MSAHGIHLHKKTKIIATIGPATEAPEIIKKLILEGVNVFRFNMKHGTIEWHEAAMEKVHKVATELEVPVGILIDLQGSEIRIRTRDRADINVTEGQEVLFSTNFDDPETKITIPHESVFEALEEGDKFSIDDGFVRFVVTRKAKNKVWGGCLDNTVIKTNKGMNLVAKDVDLPSLIEDDISKLHLATKQRVDYIALSSARTKKDVQTLREVMDDKQINAQIISKIESQKGLDNIDEIIEVSDGIMIARGGLGIEVPIEQITFHQKNLIEKCRKAHKPVIVATQMLQSMIEHPLPTRAEATDVANAVFDGTDAVMLSGETATGKYPLKAVEAMSKIVHFNEGKAEVTHFNTIPQNPTELIVQAADLVATHSAHSSKLKIDFIVVFTETGFTAKIVSSFRPKIPIIAVTDNSKTVEILTLSYGINPVKVIFPHVGQILSVEHVTQGLKERKYVKSGDNVLLIHGQHWKKAGQTNAIVLITI